MVDSLNSSLISGASLFERAWREPREQRSDREHISSTIDQQEPGMPERNFAAERVPAPTVAKSRFDAKIYSEIMLAPVSPAA